MTTPAPASVLVSASASASADDPWLPLRLEHQGRVLAAEARMLTAVRAALRTWLQAARAAALPALVAAAQLPPDPSALAGTGHVWMEAVTVHLLPAAGQVYDAGVDDAHGDVELLHVVQLKDEYLAALPNRLVGVPDDAWRQVADAVADLSGQGAGIPAIRDAVDAILGAAAWAGRAETIARTETIGAYNAGTLTAWLTSAAALEEAVDKVWVATHDERTRPDHHHADGQRVPLGGVFLVGGVPMRFPGDPVALPEQVVNCRCTMIEVPVGEPLPEVPAHPWPQPGSGPVAAAALAEEERMALPTWTGVPLAPLGAASGDRRIFALDGDWSFRDLPLPLRWAREDAPGHEGAVTIGRITSGEIQPDGLVGGGDFIAAVPETAEAVELLRAGVLYPSVDLDDFEFVYTDAAGNPIDEMDDDEFEAFLEEEGEPYLLVTRGRVMAVTLVGTQAFPQARLELVDADSSAEGPADAGGDLAAAGAPSGVGPLYPPRAWFDDPGLSELTPVTVTDDGRVFGHLADRDCHLSFLNQGACVLPPDEGGFDWFHRPEIRCDDGSMVAVGHITAGTGHPDLGLSAAAAIEHYDHTGTQVAVVRAGRDQHGIYVAGALVPEATEEQVQLLRRSPLSGDWRVIGGQRQLVAALCVNVGGFPVVRGRASGGRAVAVLASGWAGWRPSAPTPVRRRNGGARREGLRAVVRDAVAAGFAAERHRQATRGAAERIAATIGRDRASLVAVLDAQVHEQ